MYRKSISPNCNISIEMELQALSPQELHIIPSILLRSPEKHGSLTRHAKP